MQQTQQDAWDKEYKEQLLLSPSMQPHAEVMRFVRWLKKEKRRSGDRLDFEALSVLDLGSGTGRNAVYFAEEGASVTAYEFAPTALQTAKSYAKEHGLSIDYRLHDIGKPFPMPDASVDVVLDVTSSNSLSDAARAVYVQEVSRVLKPGGMLFLRTLSLEGDAHAKELIRRFPRSDPDTYVHPDIGVTEKTFTRESLRAVYEPYFTIRELKRVERHPSVGGRTYKRSYWICYLEKPTD